MTVLPGSLDNNLNKAHSPTRTSQFATEEPWHDDNGKFLRCGSPVCSVAKYFVIDQDHKPVGAWTPVPLRLWFWIPLVTFMILLAIGLEIAFHISRVQQGLFSVLL